MVMLSQLLRYHLVDGQQQRAGLSDVAISQLDVDYPPVTQLLYHAPGKAQRALPWDASTRFDEHGRVIHVADLAAGEPVNADAHAHPRIVRLGRDLLDAIIIDLQNRRVTRANDLWLAPHDGRLSLRAADVGLRAILRRLSLGRVHSLQHKALYDWKYVEFLRGDPQAVRAGLGYHGRILRLPAGEIAHLIEQLPYLHAAELLMLLPDPLAADTLESMSIERQMQVFEELEADHAVRLLEHLAPDLAADLLGRLSPEAAGRYLTQLSPAKSERLLDLLRYPEDTVGGIMTNDVVTVSAKSTVGEARRQLRDRLQGPDFVYFIYVVDDAQQQKLRGVLSLRQFVVADDARLIESIMNPFLLTLSPPASPRSAAYQLLSSQLAALPVVGSDGRLLGAVTVDTAVGLVAPRSWSNQAPRVFS
jgi:CBS domain-containing protein